MSINMYVGEVRQQVQSINSSCQSTVATMEQIQQALSAIIIEPGLKGATYDSMKNYFNTVYMPVTKGFILVCERMIEANQQFLNRYLDQVDVNSLQESILEERIRQYNRLSEMLDTVIDPTGLTDRMVDGLQEMRQQTSRKLDSLREYDYFSMQIFDELETQLATLEAGVTILSEGKAWNQSTGTFSTMGLNLDWAGDINKSWKSYDDKKKGIDEDKNKKLAKYTIIKCYDPVTKKTTWALEKDGLGVTDPELTAYLRKVGNYLDKDDYSMVELSPKEWEKRVNNVWKINGTEYFSGKQYGWWMSVLAHGQDAKGKLDESGVWDSLWSLGFIYGAVKSFKKNASVDEISWSLNENGANINGRIYSRHALERMAPNIPEVRAQLHTRAQNIAKNKGLVPGTLKYSDFIKKYIQPRNISPMVIENAISKGIKTPGNQINTWRYETNDVVVITNGLGDIMTVIPK